MRRWSFFTQVFAGIFFVIFFALAVGTLATENALSERLKVMIAEDTRATAISLGATLKPERVQEQIEKIANLIDRRITIIRPDGLVLADSQVSAEQIKTIENHLDRPEVRSAIDTGWGWSTRHSSTTGHDFLYVAVLDTQQQRVVRVAVPLEHYSRTLQRIRYGILSGALLGIFLALALAFTIARRLSHDVNVLVLVGQERARGLRTSFVERSNEDFNRLAQTLDAMTQQLDARLDELESERSRLRVILENMVEGVILCDEQGDIVLWNEAFLRMFAARQPAGRKLIEVIRNPEVVKLSTQIMTDRQPQSIEFQSGAMSIQTTFVPLARTRMEGYLAVFHDITELKRADRIRRDFVANVSHELRTPLASIAGYGESLLEGAIDDPAVARPFVEGVVRNAERLSLLIEDVLDLARIESGRYSLNPESIELKSIADSSAQVVTRIEIKRQHFENTIVPGTFAWADRKGLGQILVNLIENASKYTPPETRIRVSASVSAAAPSMIDILVADTGPGIPPDDLPRIFERFFRGDKSRNAAGEAGTGLGLAICKHLATEMGGSISAESSGRGTTVTLRLPASR